MQYSQICIYGSIELQSQADGRETDEILYSYK